MKSATMGVRELRDGLSQHLALVRSGTEITVTDHGRPIARIVPVAADQLQSLVAERRVIPPDAARKPPPARQRAKGSVSDLIER
ncbi:MAG: type II toxin-antitoxin system Phd/YefM family antitoxin [Actinomycetota bacterium]